MTYIPNKAGLRSILRSDRMREVLVPIAERIAGRARDVAPVVSGRYVGSIRVVPDLHKTRWVVHVGAHVPYALDVEARHATLRKSLG